MKKKTKRNANMKNYLIAKDDEVADNVNYIIIRSFLSIEDILTEIYKCSEVNTQDSQIHLYDEFMKKMETSNQLIRRATNIKSYAVENVYFVAREKADAMFLLRVKKRNNYWMYAADTFDLDEDQFNNIRKHVLFRNPEYANDADEEESQWVY